MKFEKLSENKLRITLNIRDLTDNDIDYQSFMANSDNTQKLFLDMLDKAEREVGFVTKNYKIMIEALVTSTGEFVVTVTRSLPDELHASQKKRTFKTKRKSVNSLNNKIIYSFHPNIIHCHNSHIIKYIFLHKFYKTFLTVHDTRLPLICAKYYDHIIAISQAVKDDLCKHNIKNVSIVHNGIETHKILHKNSSSLDKIQCKIVQVSRLEHLKKGQHFLIEALNLLVKEKKTIPIKISIDFIGIGSSETYLKKLMSKYNLNDSIHFLGLKDREYIYSHLKNYDMLVQPSLNEGFGLTVAEGMVAGIPVLVSDIEGPMEVIESGKYGFTFECGNVFSLAQQIKYIIEHPNEANNIAIQAQKFATRNYDISNMVENYDQIYIL